MEMTNNSTIANVTLNSHVFGQFFHEVLVCGSKGYLVCRSGDLYARLLSSNKEEVLFLDNEDLSDNNITISAKNVLPKPYVKGLMKMISALKEAFQCSPEEQLRDNSVDSEEKVFHWAKEAVNLAANFEDGLYIQAVIEAIKFSSKNKEWVRINHEIN
jgi:predicted dehydrogenase